MNTNDESLRVARARLVARGHELRNRIRRVALEETARREMNLIKGALARIEAGTFARCEACGSDIEAARRVAIPYATRCRHCAEDS